MLLMSTLSVDPRGIVASKVVYNIRSVGSMSQKVSMNLYHVEALEEVI